MPMFTEEDAKAQRSDVACPSHTVDAQEAAEQVLNSALRDPRAFAFDVTSVVPAMQRRASGGPYSEPSPGNHSVQPWACQFSGLPVQVDPWLRQSSRCGPMGIILTAAAVKH